jgi:Tol biopolymer transport system component
VARSAAMISSARVTFDAPANNVATWIDDRQLAYSGEAGGGGRGDIAVLSLGTPETRRVLGPTPEFGETNPTVSPDGRWLAYESNRRGRRQVYVRPFPDLDSGEFQVTTDGGTRPVWARDGRELYIAKTRSWMRSATVDGQIAPVQEVRLAGTITYRLGTGIS